MLDVLEAAAVVAAAEVPLAVIPADELVVILLRQRTGKEQDGHAFNRSNRNTTSQASKVCLILTLCGQEGFAITLVQNLAEYDVFRRCNSWVNGPY